MNRRNLENAVFEPEKLHRFTLFTYLKPAKAGETDQKHDVPRKSPNSGRREGATQSPCGIQASDRREVRPAILHHLPGWEGCSSVSLRRVAEDRGKAYEALELQPHEEEVFEPHQLLRPVGGDRRT